MMAALIGGERNPTALAQLARGRMRARIGALQEAFTGHFTDHHGSCWARCWPGSTRWTPTSLSWTPGSRRWSSLSPQAAERLDEIPGVGPVAAAIIIAEIGIDMTRFPTAGHLASWAKFAPGVKESAGQEERQRLDRARQPLPSPRPGRGRRRTGPDRHLPRRALPADRPPPRQEKSIVAIGRSILVIIWHLLSDPEARYNDLGSDYYDNRINPDAKQTQPHPPTRSTRLQSHPRTRRLTKQLHPSPAPLRSAGHCRTPSNSPIFGLEASGSLRVIKAAQRPDHGSAQATVDQCGCCTSVLHCSGRRAKLGGGDSRAVSALGQG